LVDQKNIDETKATQLMKRDKSEGQKYGQQLLKTIFHSEFFITNSTENIDSLKPKLKRYVNIMMGDQTVTPTIEENAMFHAHSASVKSGCLSKQVGAAIIDKKGNLLATGCNDVPKSGGGIYSTEDGENDSRCMFKYGGKCINEKEKVEIFDDVGDILNAHIKNKRDATKILNEIKEHRRLKNLIEYCRAIHAEMDAITSVARNGGTSLQGAWLFSTTFPCHNCARHIIATGISKVFYIEPYEKSLALRLHKDSISFDNSVDHSNKKVEFISFEGVSPNKYLKLFYAEGRKKDGARVELKPKTAKPTIPMFLDTRYEYESKILENLQNIGFLQNSL
jgi:deoxycytidylate deaminase